jgi:hypothetical protein
VVGFVSPFISSLGEGYDIVRKGKHRTRRNVNCKPQRELRRPKENICFRLWCAVPPSRPGGRGV